MKKIFLLFVIIALTLLSCQNGEMEERKIVAITFNTDGGTEIPVQEVLFNALVDQVETPEKEGFRFAAWYKDDAFTQPFDFDATLESQYGDYNEHTEGITLYARYLPRIYRVIYNGNGNTEGEVPVDNNLYAAGDTFSPILIPIINDFIKREGIMFSCWLVSNVASVENPLVDFTALDPQYNKYYVNIFSIITVGECDVELIARYQNDPPSADL